MRSISFMKEISFYSYRIILHKSVVSFKKLTNKMYTILGTF